MLPPASASPETQICGQRLSTLSPLKERLRPPIGDHRLKSLALNGGNVGLFRTPGNYPSFGRLRGGAEGIRTANLSAMRWWLSGVCQEVRGQGAGSENGRG